MKPSRYNVFLELDGTTILGYNCLTTALVRLDRDEYVWLRDLDTRRQAEPPGGDGRADLQAGLARVGLLVPDDLDEVAWLRQRREMSRAHNRAVGLTILPTLNCNFRCTYCFSYLQKARMSPDVQAALLRFVAPRLPGASSLGVAWFGGEPTLGIDIIERLSARLAEACAAEGVPVGRASIVSNGYLLDRRMVGRLKAAGVGSAQITLDGDRAAHDQRRSLARGRGTFDRILDNIEAAAGDLAIQVRINVDRSNADAAIGALDALAERGLQGQVSVYFGHVKAFTEACASAAGSCLSDQEFSDVELRLTKEALARGFASLPYPSSQLDGVCGAVQRECFVVAPTGLLFKCWAEASLGEIGRWGAY